MSTSAQTGITTQTYTVWGAFGSVIIATGTEPVWLGVGEPAERLAEIEAESYEGACAAWRATREAQEAQGS